MKSYIDLIEQTFDFPTPELAVQEDELLFNEVPLMDLIRQYGTPLRLTYLPRIRQNIHFANRLFQEAIGKYSYQGQHTYCYSTRSAQFDFILRTVLETGSQLETSSAFDLDIILNLYERGLVDTHLHIICNGFKRPEYQERICKLINMGFHHCIPVLDNLKELDYYEAHIKGEFSVGIRLAADEEPNFEFYTSRLGIRYSEATGYFKERISGESRVRLRMLHFNIDTGIKDTAYYWSELSRFMFKYCELKKICPDLSFVGIGGGFPVKTSLAFDYDYAHLTEQIIENMQWICRKNHVQEPDIYTDFGGYTVGESGATIYSVMGQKLQNDKELWYMIDGSFITNLPDSWGLNQKYIMLAINKWAEPFHKVNLGGLTCDSMDYYNSEAHSSEVFLPKILDEEPLYIGFFHTGAYEDALGGYGGIQHCLIPAPQQVIVDRDAEGKITSDRFAEEQNAESMLRILGY